MPTPNSTNIVLRSDVDRPLLHGEMDLNFSELKNVIDQSNQQTTEINTHQSILFKYAKRFAADLGLELSDETFETGGTVNTSNQAVFKSDGTFWVWTGSFPKIFSEGVDPLDDVLWVDRSQYINRNTIRSNLKRLAAEAGYNLVDGSFEEGGVLNDLSDVLWYQQDGKYYSWGTDEAKTVPANSTPASTGGISAGAWVDRTDVTLRDELSRITETFNSKLKLKESLTLFDFDPPTDGVTDAGNIINSAIVYASTNNKRLCISGNYFSSVPILVKSGRYDIDMSDSKITFADGVMNGMIIGDAGGTPFGGNLINPVVSKNTFEVGSAGFNFVNCVESSVINPISSNFEKAYAATPYSSSRVAYNAIINPKAFDHTYGFYALPDAGCYVNENTFISGRFNVSVSGRLVDHIHLDNTNGTGCDHNKFIGVSIEGYSGGGSCGSSAVKCIKALSNAFEFCRTEKYGTGWTSSSYNFDVNSKYNDVNDTNIDTTITDSSGLNSYKIPTLGIKSSDARGGVAHNVIKYTRQVANTVDASKFAIDITDTYSSSGKVGFLKYTSPIGESRSGELIHLTTGYGDVFILDDAGSIFPRDNFAYLGSSSKRWAQIWATLPTFATDSAAGTGGLTSGAFYKTSTGELRIKL